MKDLNCTLGTLFKEVAAACQRTTRHGMRTLSRMSWPALLLSCVLLALIATILPLAIVLFAIFMAIKLCAASAGYALCSGKHEASGKSAE